MQTTFEFNINGRQMICDVGCVDRDHWYIIELRRGKWVRIIVDQPSRDAAIAELRDAVKFLQRAHADPKGIEVGAVRDGEDWVLKAAAKAMS